MTSTLSRAIDTQYARPMPREPPVTITTLPFSRIVSPPGQVPPGSEVLERLVHPRDRHALSDVGVDLAVVDEPNDLAELAPRHAARADHALFVDDDVVGRDLERRLHVAHGDDGAAVAAGGHRIPQRLLDPHVVDHDVEAADDLLRDIEEALAGRVDGVGGPKGAGPLELCVVEVGARDLGAQHPGELYAL